MSKVMWCSFLGDGSFAGVASAAPPHVLALLASFAGQPGVARALAARMAPRGAPVAPDLVEVLAERGFAGPGREDLTRFHGLLAPRTAGLFVGRCVVDDDGRFAVAVYARSRVGSVRVGDTFFGGVQMSGDVASGVVLVEPHVLRAVCANGAAVPVADDRGCYARWSKDDAEGDLDAVVETALSGRTTRDVEIDLRRATRIRLPSLADLRARGLLRVDDALATSIAGALRSEERTLYGFFNAMTRVARDTADLRRSLPLERAAGRLVAALVRRREPGVSEVAAPVPV